MLYRIEMNIFDMTDKIAVISDLMFPETALPDSLFSFIKLRCRLPSSELFPAMPAEVTLDLAPSRGEVVVIFRQGPDAMQMVRQQHKSVDGKRVSFQDGLESFSQQWNTRFVTKYLSPLVCYNGKKERCAFCSGSFVSHVSSINRLSGSNSPPLAANVPNEDGSHTPLLAAG
jgi:hypothetical protein